MLFPPMTEGGAHNVADFKSDDQYTQGFRCNDLSTWSRVHGARAFRAGLSTLAENYIQIFLKKSSNI